MTVALLLAMLHNYSHPAQLSNMKNDTYLGMCHFSWLSIKNDYRTLIEIDDALIADPVRNTSVLSD